MEEVLRDGPEGWWADLLKHPDGRAIGGEPCVKCAEPIPANAYWKYRDRHVCSARCDSNLKRQLNRALASGRVQVPEDVANREPLSNPRQSPPGRLFGTVVGDEETRFEYEGYGPLPGDIVERFGILTSYEHWRPDQLLGPLSTLHAEHGFHVAASANTGHCIVSWADEFGLGTRTVLGHFGPDRKYGLTETFVHPLHGVELLWEHEIVREVHADGRDYTWEAWVCVPVSHARQAGAVIWSPRFKERSELRKRTTQTYNRHLRRLRVQRATAERFDAREIFERDGWTCQLCGEAVESDLAWPDPGCASLDHVKPILAGGEHSRANTQLAHWLCNVRKGARYVEP